ncbi:MAG: hypothetical protein DI538_15810 [Azospira oryzae]|jgi:hypothetical protein|nr:MAG: hypothetical protein DI538_15810 [Azospira oryzae]
MKTIKTGTGLKRIEDQDPEFISLQLRVILQEHRTNLIDALLRSGLDRYIDYKFNRKVSGTLLDQLKARLVAIKNGGISMMRYQPLLDSVMKYDFVQLTNTLFFEEIDMKLKERLAQKELFHFPIQESQAA